jgi:hypothetical protein
MWHCSACLLHHRQGTSGFQAVLALLHLVHILPSRQHCSSNKLAVMSKGGAVKNVIDAHHHHHQITKRYRCWKGSVQAGKACGSFPPCVPHFAVL